MPRTPERLRILVLTWRDEHHPEAGGSERTLGEVARGLVRRGHEVTVLTARYPGSAAVSVEDGVRFVRQGNRLSVYPRGLLYSLRHRPDRVLDVQNGVPFAAAAAAGSDRGVLLVHHVHREQWRVATGPVTARVGWFLESRVSPLLHRGRRVVAMSPATRTELVGLGFPADHVTVVLNGTEPPPDDLPEPSGHRLVTLSRLVPHKQVDHAVEVLAAVLEQVPDATLTVIGDGYERATLESLVGARGLTDHVEFTGRVDEHRKYELLARSTVHLLPSVKEGWGLAAVEAGSVGVPTVAYRSAGGVRDSIEDQRTGLLVGDPQEMAKAVLRLLTDTELHAELAAGARARAARLHWEATVDGFERVLLAGTADRAGA